MHEVTSMLGMGIKGPHSLQPGVPEHPVVLQGHWEGPQQSLPCRKPGARETVSPAPLQLPAEPEHRLPVTLLLPPRNRAARAASPEPTRTSCCCYCSGHWKQKRRSGLSFSATFDLLPLTPIDRTRLQPCGKGVWDREKSEFQPPVIQRREGQSQQASFCCSS